MKPRSRATGNLILLRIFWHVIGTRIKHSKGVRPAMSRRDQIKVAMGEAYGVLYKGTRATGNQDLASHRLARNRYTQSKHSEIHVVGIKFYI